MADIKNGYLSVLSTDGKGWKKRYCNIKNRVLYIYETKEKSDEKSNSYQILYFVPLARVGVISTAVKGGPNGRPNCFKLAHQVDESFIYWLSSENESELKEWVNYIQLNCAIQKEPETVEVRGRSKSVVYRPAANQISNSSDHSGYLKKQSTGLFKKGQWKKKFFVLKDLILYYYDTSDSKALKGRIQIPNWTIDPTEQPANSIKLSHIGYPTVVLQAETTEERNLWIKHIKQQDKELTTTAQMTEEKLQKLKNWLSTITTLDIKEPCQFMSNATFVQNILDKCGVKIALISKGTEASSDNDWTLKSFEIILKVLQTSNVKYDHSITAKDFVEPNNTLVLSFAISLMEHFSSSSNSTSTNNNNNNSLPSSSTTQNNNNNSPQTPTKSDINNAPTTTTVDDTTTTTNNNNSNGSDQNNVNSQVETNQKEAVVFGVGPDPSIVTTSIDDLTNPSLMTEESNYSLTSSGYNSSSRSLYNKLVSPHRQLKRVETKEVLGEFDKIFSSIGGNYQKCGLCNEPIMGEAVEAVGKSWHPHHLQCCACGKQLKGLEEIPYVERNGNIYCKEDHDKTFKESFCTDCNKSLMITFAHKGKVYCKDHYSNLVSDLICQQCEKPIGDEPYHSIENKKWHRNHFTCSYCKVGLIDGICSIKNSSPYCKKCYGILF
eukprot:gene2547-3151_t